MTIWYVDSTIGSDTNDGKTPGTAFVSVQRGHDLSVAGDTIYIAPGVYSAVNNGTANSSGYVLSVTRFGTAGGGYITYRNYPGQPFPVFQTPSTTDTCIQLNGSAFSFSSQAPMQYLIFQNIEMVGCNGEIALSDAWTNASAIGFSTKYAQGCIGPNGLSANNTTIAANTTTSSTTLNLQSNPTTAGVKVGDVVMNTSNFSSIPAGTTVASVGTTSVTTSVAVSAASGNTIRFVHPCHHIIMLNCIMHDFAASSVTMEYNDYVAMIGCVIYNNAWYSPGGSSGATYYKSIDVDANTTSYKNCVIGCVFYNNQNIIANVNQSRVTTTAASTVGSGTAITVASASGILAGMQVFNSTTASSITPGTTVVSVVGTTVNLSLALSGTVTSGNTLYFAGFSDGNGFSFDDTNGDQSPACRSYAGKQLAMNNLCINNGGPGINAFNSHVDSLFNTCYRNVSTSYFSGLSGYSDIGYSGTSGTTLTGSTGVVANNILYSLAGVTLNGKAGTDGGTWSFNLSFGGSGSLPGTNNISGQDPLFVNPSTTPTNAFTYLPSSDIIPPITYTGFQLQPGSPAIDAAGGGFTRTLPAWLPGALSAASVDILWNAGLFGPSYDMGAYESPASPWGSNPIQSMSTILNTLFADGQAAGSITPLRVREALVSIWAGRSPYPR